MDLEEELQGRREQGCQQGAVGLILFLSLNREGRRGISVGCLLLFLFLVFSLFLSPFFPETGHI